jgi:hypothetical protein
MHFLIVRDEKGRPNTYIGLPFFITDGKIMHCMGFEVSIAGLLGIQVL